MNEGPLLYYIAIVVLIALSAFFSGSEIAYTSVNTKRLRANYEKKPTPNRKAAVAVSERYDMALSTILIGNNLVNISSSSIATLIVLHLLGDGYSWVATVAMTLLLLTFGEILPKVVASSVAEGFATVVSIPLRILMFVLWPIVAPLMALIKLIAKLWEKDSEETTPKVTEDELEIFIETAEDEGVIDEERSDLLQSALEFDDVLAYEALTHRVDLVTIDIDDTPEEIMQTVSSSPYTRIPVYQDTIDNIIGILHLNHLYKSMVCGRKLDIKDSLMPANFVHKTMPMPDVLAVMKKKQCHMVIVTDEYGGTMGVLTMEDVLEELVGDIWDESDEIIDAMTQIDECTYDVDGDMSIYDFLDEMDIDDRDFDDSNATLGGWAIEMIGGYPSKGDTFTYENLTLTVTSLSRHRVERLTVKVGPKEEPESED